MRTDVVSDSDRPESRADKEIFFDALDISAAEDRRVFLEWVCAGDLDKRRRLDRLIAYHFDQGGFMQSSAAPESREAFAPLDDDSGKVVGYYKLLEKLGEGGFGVVYVAEQRAPVKRRVALKIIKLGMDTRHIVARFEAERQALAMMDHPHIAKVFDAGATETGRPYFVMELVRGVRITDYCAERKLTVEERLKLFAQVCQAIQHAHQKGIIHRDIKPSNILITSHDEVAVPKVIDFGIAKAIEGDLTDKTLYTQFHQFIGTPAYMSPEQAEISGLGVDTRTDIYALGVLLYELLAGQTPFDGGELLKSGLEQMRKTIREKEPVRPSTRLRQGASSATARISVERASLPTDLDWIVMKCLEKDRARRYQSASDLASDVCRHLSNEPVLARPPSRSYRFQKAWQRNRVLFTAGIVAVAALVAGISISTWQAVKANRAEAKALHSIDAESKQRRRADAEKENAQSLLYTANMQLAQQMWDQNNLSRLRQLLDETRDFPRRGFEWYYWKRLSTLASWHLRGHLKAVTAVAFSPDGQRVLTASKDATAKIWDVEKRSEIFSLEGHTAGIHCAAWSDDSRFIATGSQDHSAKIWNAQSGRELASLKMENERAEGIALDPRGRFVAVGGNGGTVRVFRVPDGKELLHFQAHPLGMLSVACSPDGSRIATSSKDQTVRVWNIADGKLVAECIGHRDWVDKVAFSPDGSRLLTGSGDQSVRVWDAATGRGLLTIPARSGFVNSVAFSPDGTLIATAHNNWAVKIWNAASGAELFSRREHTGEPICIAFSPDSSRILTGSEDSTAILADFSSKRQKIQLVGSLPTGTDAIGFSPDNRRIVAGAPNDSAGIWEVNTGRLLFLLKGHRNVVQSASYAPDGATIVTSSADGTIKLWRASDGAEIKTIKGHRGNVGQVAFSPDGRQLVSASDDLTARVWDASSGAEIHSFAHSNIVYTAAFSPDGRKIATGCQDSLVHIWDAQTGRESLTFGGHSGGVRSVSFSPDGARIATGGDVTARVWDGSSGKLLQTFFNHAAQVRCVSFSPDGCRVLSSVYGENEHARIWDSYSGKELLIVPGFGHFSGFSPDANHLAISGPGGVTVYTAEPPLNLVRLERDENAQAQLLRKSLQSQEERERAWAVARASDEGSIKQWLILAPIPITNAVAIPAEREAALRPAAGDSWSEGSLLKWTPTQSPSNLIDLKLLCGGRAPDSVGYMVAYVISDRPQTGVRLLVGADDRGKIFVNGQAVYESTFNRSYLADEDAVEGVSLNAGLNVIVFKVINDGSDWQASLRMTDSSENPLRGIRVILQRDQR